MGTPDNDPATKAYENYAFRDELSIPKPPEGYNVQLAFLQEAQDIFTSIDISILGFVPLDTIVPDCVALELVDVSDLLVVSVFDAENYGLCIRSTAKFTQLDIMLTINGTWLVHIIGTEHELHVLNNATDLVSFLEQRLASYGELRSRWVQPRRFANYPGSGWINTGSIGLVVHQVIKDAVSSTEARLAFAKKQSEALAGTCSRMDIYEF